MARRLEMIFLVLACAGTALAQATILIGKFELTTARPQTISNVVLRAVPPGAVLEDIKLDATLRNEAIEAVIARLNEFYVYPRLADTMAESLRAHQKKGDYNNIG